MATLASLTLNVLDMVYGQTPVQRPDFDTLESAVAAAGTTAWRFAGAGTQLWERGDYAEYFKGDGTAGEVVQLTADHDVAGANVTVLRAQRGTTAASSYAAGNVFLKNPPFTQTEIQRAINETVDVDMQIGIWYQTNRSITYQTNRNRYPLNASDFDVERIYQIDANPTAVGAATFDYTGGASEDLWSTSSAHGLAVGDPVRFTAAGTGATEYAAGIVYWVAAVPSTTTFQLSATESTTVLEGTADSIGTWTLELIEGFSYREWHRSNWEVVQRLDPSRESTGKALLVGGGWSDTDSPLFYDARTYPSSSDISTIPAEMAKMIPWGTIARLVGGTATRGRYDPNSAAQQGTIQYADSEFFKRRFEDMRDNYKTKLLKEVRPQKHWVWGPISG